MEGLKMSTALTSKCLICNEGIQTNGINAPIARYPPKKFSRDDNNIPILCDRSKFALTPVQYSVLQKVLTLPDGACKNELILGPYCRECFTNINNVCHCMSALENLQQSVIEFRKDFSRKIQKSNVSAEIPVKGARKRKSNPSGDSSDAAYSARSTLLNYLNKNVFTGGVPADLNSKHIHETISNMDPNPQSPVQAELVVRTTNGNMPALRISRSKASRKKVKLNPQSKRKMKHPNKSNKAPTATTTPKPTTSTTPNPTTSKSTISNTSKKTKQQKPVSTPTSTTPADTTTEPDYKCWCCSKRFRTEEALDKHEEIAHKHRCTFAGCTRVFHTGKSLTSHMLKAHHIATTTKKKSRGDVKGRMKKCDVCSRYFPNYKSLAKHHAENHAPKKPKLNNSSINKNAKTSDGRPGRCKICTKIVANVQTHMRTIHPESVIESQQKSKVIKKEEDDSPGVQNEDKNSFEYNAKLTESIDSLYLLKEDSIKSEEKFKTEDNNDIVTNNGHPASFSSSGTVPETKSRSPSASPKPVNFQVPSTLTKLPSPTKPPPQPAASSKYQFKNLLKIGEGDKV